MIRALSNNGRIDRRFAFTVTGIAALYFLAAKFGLSMAFATPQVTAVWPPSGLAVAALLFFGQRIWPGVFFGALLVNATLDQSLVTAAGIAIGNTLGPVFGTFLLRRVVIFDSALTHQRDVFNLLVFGALLAMTVSASNGVFHLALSGNVSWGEASSVWWVWWVGDAMGVILFAPLLLSWLTQPKLNWRGWRLVEFAALLCGLITVSHFVFSYQNYNIQYAVFPFIIWAALRFGQRETSTVVLLLSGFALSGAIQAGGEFVAGTLDERLILLDVFMAVAAITGLVMSAITTERNRAEAGLQCAHGELEIRVQERTADLATANRELVSKNEEVEAFVYIVSHDLRAPLVNMQGFATELEESCRDLEQTLQGGTFPNEVTARVSTIVKTDIGSALHFIRASTSKFQRLIDSLVKLSRSGQQEPHFKYVNIEEVVSATLDSLQNLINKSGTNVHCINALPPAAGDATAIGQVFSNLIVNAINYQKPGRPGKIEIGGIAQDDMIHFWVKDNGAGIADAAKPRLFQVFQRFHPELAPGEGMGLAIIKRVVERHNGQVWAESTENIGTTIHFTLPAARNGGG